MRRHTTSRVLLSVLLLWQLGAGMFAHAQGMTGQGSSPSAIHDSAMRSTTVHDHCGKHESMVDGDVSTDASVDQGVSPQHHRTRPDCCQSQLCKCPCMQALALSVSLPFAADALPDSLNTLLTDTPLLHAGVSGLFRPPI